MRRFPSDGTGDADISLADLLIALSRLKPRDATTREAVLRLVGFETPRPAPAPALPAETPQRRSSRDVADGRRSEGRPEGQPVPTARRRRLEPAGIDVPAVSQPRSGAALSEETAADASPVRSTVPPLKPLLDPRWARDIVAAAVATTMPIGGVYIAALVRMVARGKPVLAIPRLPSWTLLRGAQVLVDLGESMEPFAADQAQLVEALRRVAGSDRVRVLSFRGTPARAAGEGPLWTWRPWRAPTDGSRVVLLSDLGAGPSTPDAAPPDEWVRALDAMPAPTPIVFSPYPRARVSPAILKRVVFLHWDRRLTPRTASNQQGRASRP